MVTPILSRGSLTQMLVDSMPRTTCRMLAFYDSSIDAVITDPAYMRISVTDKLVEGWAVFDTCNLYSGHLYQLDSHLGRLLKSAELAKIPAPMTIKEMASKVSQLLEFADSDFCRVRLLLSRSRNFEVESSVFYALAYTDPAQSKPLTVKEVTVSVPVKPKELAIIKSNSYLINSLCVMEARDKGGYMGIQLDENNCLAESAIANVAVLLPGGHFRTPKPDAVLEGTTLKRVFEYCQGLIGTEELQSVERENVSYEEVLQSQEMMFLGGDSCIGIVELDSKPIGDGKLGKLTQKIQRFLEGDRLES